MQELMFKVKTQQGNLSPAENKLLEALQEKNTQRVLHAALTNPGKNSSKYNYS